MKLLLSLLLTGFAAAAEWKAGVARVSITPTEPVWMAGYAARKKPHESVRQEIYAKALAIEDATGKTAVLITADLSGFPGALANRVAERVRTKSGISRDRLWLNASHNHSGPVTSDYIDTRPGFKIPIEQAEPARRYTASLEEKLTGIVEHALASRVPATLSFEQGFAGFAVNRRRVVMGRQLPGPVDHDVPVLAVRGESGALIAVVAGYSCHATVTSDYELSGDWPGAAQEEIERMHPGATALFVQNTGADANPYPRGNHELTAQFGRLFAVAADQVLRGKMRPVRGPLSTAFETVDVPFQKPGATYPYPVQVWRFGGDLKLIALGGEVVVDYGIRLRQLYGWNDTWVAGYSNDVFAYIPSVRVLREGGYEGGEAMPTTALPGPFAERIEEIIVNKVAGLMASTEKRP
jgi:neutral ceramidase